MSDGHRERARLGVATCPVPQDVNAQRVAVRSTAGLDRRACHAVMTMLVAMLIERDSELSAREFRLPRMRSLPIKSRGRTGSHDAFAPAAAESLSSRMLKEAAPPRQ